MKKRFAAIFLSGVITLGTIGLSAIETIYSASYADQTFATHGNVVETASNREAEISNGVRYRLDANQSRFTIDANSSGLLWFLGHNHHIAARDFSGEAELSADRLVPASLQMTIKTESLAETGERVA